MRSVWVCMWAMKSSLAGAAGWRGVAGIAVIAGLVPAAIALALPSPAAATDYTWSGATANSSGSSAADWSTATNWAGGTAPTQNETVGTLTFPALSSCNSSDTCYTSANDLTGISASAISLESGAGYTIAGNAITLGSGGLTLTPSSSGVAPFISLPISLDANQTWTLGGSSTVANLDLDGDEVTGENSNLTADLNNARLALVAGTDVEVGAFAASGNGNAFIGLEGSLNGTDGNPVSLTGVTLGVPAPGDRIGPLSMSGGELMVGHGLSPDGTLAVDGGVTLASTSVLQMFIDRVGTTPSSDYSQLTATGDVNLGSATLELLGGSPCPTLNVGDVYTLVSTTGSLSGTFHGLSDGSTTQLPCGGGTEPTLVINYTAHSVTATLPATTTALSASPASAVTNQGVTLTARVSPSTATGTLAFENGGSALPGCSGVTVVSGIASCQAAFSAAAPPGSLTAVFTPAASSGYEASTSPPVTLTVARDTTATALTVSTATPTAGRGVTYRATVGSAHTGAAVPSGAVEFLDGGTAIGGCSSQPLSAGQATCTLSYASPGSHSITATYLGDGNFAGSISAAQTVTVTTTPPRITPVPVAMVRAALSGVLSPKGRLAKLGAILKAGGFTFTFNAPESGTLTIGWYELAPGAHLTSANGKDHKKPRAKPVLIATGTMTVGKMGTIKIKVKLTNAGKRLLKHAKGQKLTGQASFTPTGGTATTRRGTFVLKR